jgi:hypothetical protein
MRPELTEEEKIDRIKILARAELQRTDWKIMRAIERMVAGDAWCAWRDELRSIASKPEGHDDLPPEPAFGAPAQPEPTAPREEIVEVPVPAVVEEAAAFPQADGIPDNLRSLMVDGEPPVKFTERMRRRFRALKHLQIDGTRPTNARTFPDMSEEEIQELKDLEAKGAETVKWLDVQV